MVTASLSVEVDYRKHPVAREAILEQFCAEVGIILTPEIKAFVIPRPKEKLGLGGWQGSKSTSQGLDLAVDIELRPPGRQMRYWGIMPNYKTPTKEIDYLAEWYTKKRVQVHYQKPQNDSVRLELYGGQAVIETRTAMDPEGIASEAVDGVFLVEAGQMKPTVRDHAQGRILTRDGWLDMTGTLEDEEANIQYAWYGELAAKWKKEPSPEYLAVSIPSWANPFAFPGGRNDPKILRLEHEYKEKGEYGYFLRYICGEPAGFRDRLYAVLDHGEWGWIDSGKTPMLLSKGAGGHDYGEGWTDEKRGHPSTLAAVQVTQGDIAIVRDVWESFTGDTGEIETRRRLMSQRWAIPHRRWVFDPMQREAAKIVGAQVAPTATRLTRAGHVHQRLMNNTLKFDMLVQQGDSDPDRERKARVRRCFEQMKGVHQIRVESKGGYRFEYARVDDDMAAAVENAIDLIDSRQPLNLKGATLPSRRVW